MSDAPSKDFVETAQRILHRLNQNPDRQQNRQDAYAVLSVLSDAVIAAPFLCSRPANAEDGQWKVTDKFDTCVARCFGFAGAVDERSALLAFTLTFLINCWVHRVLVPSSELQPLSNRVMSTEVSVMRKLGYDMTEFEQMVRDETKLAALIFDECDKLNDALAKSGVTEKRRLTCAATSLE